MSFPWLEMRIAEEQDRRRRDADIRARLPRAFDELHGNLAACIAAYNLAFGSDAASLTVASDALTVQVREPRAEIRIDADPLLPGFAIHREGAPLIVETDLLPGDKLSYRDRDANLYLTLDELTRRILDRVLFPKLRE